MRGASLLRGGRMWASAPTNGGYSVCYVVGCGLPFGDGVIYHAWCWVAAWRADVGIRSYKRGCSIFRVVGFGLPFGDGVIYHAWCWFAAWRADVGIRPYERGLFDLPRGGFRFAA